MTVDDWIFEPGDFIRYWRSLHRPSNAPLRLPARVLFVFGSSFYETGAKAFRAKPADWNRRVSLGRAGRRAVAVVRSSIGAPASVIDLEEAIALGARTILTFGSCGSLVQDLPLGATVLPTAAVSDEGTSRHYGGPRWARPDEALVQRLRASLRRRSLAFREGAVWSTDAVYRESRARAHALARQNVVGVEMEASALFTIGRYRRARVASLLVVSDELAGGSWKPGFESSAFRKGVRQNLDVVRDVLAGAIP